MTTIKTKLIRCNLSLDDRLMGVLCIENDETGTDTHANYRVTLDAFRERRTFHARIENFDIRDCRRLELIAEAFRVIAVTEREAVIP